MVEQETDKTRVKDISFINTIKTVAIIGPSKKRGFMFVKSHADNFKGKAVYAVHPKLKEIPGFENVKVYPSLLDIPDKIDYVYISVPNSAILNVIDDCVKKGVKLASVFTSEFSDAGTIEGLELEKELLRRAKNKLRLIGPNGLGLYYPKLGLGWRTLFQKSFGKSTMRVGVVGQSGGLTNALIYTASYLGLEISKAFSFGNGADLDFVDLLHYLINDPETDIILSYIEGIKRGRGNKLKWVLNQTENKKPIVIVKGGQTDAGSKATFTHTASISGENKIWKVLFEQFNIIEVESLEQLLHIAYLIENYGFFALDNVAVLSGSGGYGVILTDLIEKAGMKVPAFSPTIQEKLNSLFGIAGTSPKNPLDPSAQVFNIDFMYKVIDIALSDKKIDGIIVDLPSFIFFQDYDMRKDPKFESKMIECLTLGHKHNKPLIANIIRANNPEDKERVSKKLREKKVPVFGDPFEFIPLLPKISRYSKKRKYS